jgi:hypothetical protein
VLSHRDNTPGPRVGIALAICRHMARKTGELPGKAGVKSLSKKLGNSRHGYEQHPGASKTAGAFGKEDIRGMERDNAEGVDRANEETEERND